MGSINVVWIIQAIIILVLSICVHEYGHAIVADKLGDPLPRSQGRTTLNPLAHADPMGTLLFPLMFLVMTGGLGFGWGRPVQTNPRSYTRKLTMRKGHLLVAIAGPMMNVFFGIFIAALSLVLIKFGVIPMDHQIHTALRYAIILNFVLCFFNLIPAPPLDGGAVVAGLLPTRLVQPYEKLAVYGPFVLMAIIFIPGAGRIFMIPAMFVANGLFAALGHPYLA